MARAEGLYPDAGRSRPIRQPAPDPDGGVLERDLPCGIRRVRGGLRRIQARSALPWLGRRTGLALVPLADPPRRLQPLGERLLVPALGRLVVPLAAQALGQRIH